MDLEQLTHHRRHLHRHPELSGREFDTALYVANFFKEYCPDATRWEVANTGLLIKFNGRKKKPSVMLRCELDALPIQEINTFTYCSNQPGVSHKCGHDGHTTILLAVATELQNNPPVGDVYLLFQPSEENGEGARAIVNDAAFKENCSPDYVFALHNIPGATMHKVLVKPGTFTPAVISAEIELTGKTAHAAEPQNGANPSYAAAEITLQCTQLMNNNPNAPDFSVITPVYSNIGGRDFGISAGNGQVGFTLRTYGNELMNELKSQFTDLVTSACATYGIEPTVTWTQEFRSINNNKESTDYIERAAYELGMVSERKSDPFPWGEDFGVYTENYKGALFGLGAGTQSPALHNPDYDFPDELIGSGSALFLKLIELVQQ